MLVTRENFYDIMHIISGETWVSLDTETTGLKPYQQDRLFSIIIGRQTDAFYFNFSDKSSFFNNVYTEPLNRGLIPDFSSVLRFVYMHNAKFDMAFTAKEGVRFEGIQVHCTQSNARLVKNDLMSYSLDALSKENGERGKDDIKTYCIKNKLFHTEKTPYKKTSTKIFYYDKVPLDLIIPYAERDAMLTYRLGEKQRCFLETYTRQR